MFNLNVLLKHKGAQPGKNKYVVKYIMLQMNLPKVNKKP